jgi:CubicO group peptidase (beta-lactamase class C family)
MSILPLVLIALALPPSISAQELESLLAKAMQDNHLPAMAVLKIQHGRITGQAARGVRSIDASDLVTKKDVWHIGSNGKAMTAAMIARLVDRHLLSWDTPLEKLLPELASSMQPAYRSVTLRDLLSHQAGLQANIEMSGLNAVRIDRRPMHELRLAYASSVLAQSGRCPPNYQGIF